MRLAPPLVRLALLALLGLALAGRAGAQDAALGPPVTAAGAEELATFTQAAALAVDPAGRLYVADAGRNAVYRLTLRDGRVAATDALGGSGTRPGQFDDPRDVDPTNGLVLLVADAGNGRIQRFSRNLQHLESLPVARGAEALDAGQRPVYDLGRDALDAGGSGRPVAVVSSSADETFALDATDRVVLRFDRQRRPAGLIGDAGPGRLANPVGLAVGRAERLYVADRGAGALVVFDALGTFLRTLPLPPALDLVAVAVADPGRAGDVPRLLAVGRAHLATLTPEGRLVGGLRPVDLGAPLVDAARHDGTTFLLTRRALWRLR